METIEKKSLRRLLCAHNSRHTLHRACFLFLVLLLVVSRYPIEANNLLSGRIGISKIPYLIERIGRRKQDNRYHNDVKENMAYSANRKRVQLFHKIKPQAVIKVLMNGKLTRSKRSSLRRTKQLNTAQADDHKRSEVPILEIKGFCKLHSDTYLSESIYECKVFSADLHDEMILKNIGNKNISSKSILLPSNKTYKYWFVQKLTLLNHDITVIKSAFHQWQIPTNVSTLLLRKLNVAVIEGEAFWLLKDTLRHLSLDNNAISYIAKKAFAGLDRLLELDLSYNRIQSLPACLFAGLMRLKKLKLMHNEIEHLGWKALSGLWSLTFLDLSSNALEDVHAYGFRSLRYTRSVVIDLSRNKLSHPRKEWLLLGKAEKTFCSDKSNLKLKSLQNDKKTLEAELESNEMHHLSATRTIWAEENLWTCRCSGPYNVLEFAKTMLSSQSYVAKSGLLLEPSGMSSNHFEHSFQYDSIHKVSWDLAFQCVAHGNFTGMTIDSSPKSLKRVFENCCAENVEQSNKNLCKFIEDWLINNTEFAPEEIAADSSGLTDNQVTVIGIIIVVLSPILLTLCPDCNKQMGSSKQEVKNNSKNETKLNKEQTENSRINIIVTKHWPEASNQSEIS